MCHLGDLVEFAFGVSIGVGGTLLGFVFLMIWAYAVSFGFWRSPEWLRNNAD